MRRSLVLCAVGTVLLAACSRSPEPVAGTDLLFSVTDGETSAWTLTCDPSGGTHPDPQAACEFLDEAKKDGKDPFKPVDPDKMCAEIYGGPQTATITGTWNGKPVDAKFSRANACEIARWDKARPLLVVAGGASPN